MPFNFDECRTHVQTCVKGVTDPAGVADPGMVAEMRLHYGSRLFFINQFDHLFGKANTIVNLIRDRNIIPADKRPSLPDWTSASAGRAITLFSAMRLKHALECIAAGSNQTAKKWITLPNGTLLSIGADDIVPSVYFADPDKLRTVRDALGITRRDLSKAAVGGTQLAAYLEDGDRNQRFRITHATALRLYETLIELSKRSNYAHLLQPFDVMFAYHYGANANCSALPKQWGNIIAV